MIKSILSQVHHLEDGETGPLGTICDDILHRYRYNDNHILKEFPNNAGPGLASVGGAPIHITGGNTFSFSALERITALALSRMLSPGSVYTQFQCCSMTSARDYLLSSRPSNFTICYVGEARTVDHGAYYNPTRSSCVIPTLNGKFKMTSGEPTCIYKIRTDMSRKTNKEILDLAISRSGALLKVQKKNGYTTISILSNIFALCTIGLMVPTIVFNDIYKLSFDPEENSMPCHTPAAADYIKNSQLQGELDFFAAVVNFIREKMEKYSTTIDKLSLTQTEETELIEIYKTYLSSHKGYNFDDPEKFPAFAHLNRETVANAIGEGYASNLKQSILNAIENAKSHITDYLRAIAEYQKDLKKKQLELFSVDAQSKEVKSMLSYLTTLISKSPVIKAAHVEYEEMDHQNIPKLFLDIRQPLGISDAEKWKNSFPGVMNDMGVSNTEKDFFMRLFEDIWVKKRFTLFSSSVVKFSPLTGSYRAADMNTDPTAFANPHIMGFNCFGSYNNMIIEAIANSHYDEAVELILSACSEVNWADPPVVKKLIRYMQDGKDSIRGILDVANDRMLTVKDIEDMYKAEDAAKEAEEKAKAEAEKTKAEEAKPKKVKVKAELTTEAPAEATEAVFPAPPAPTVG